MSNTTGKYSPGPWVTGYSSFDHALGVWQSNAIGQEEYPPVCKVAPIENTTDEDHANANLIAAAPDLLGVLEEFVSKMDELPNSNEVNIEIWDTYHVAKRTIEKAHGGKAPETAAKERGENLMDMSDALTGMFGYSKKDIDQVVANMVRNDEIGLKLLEALKFCKGVIEANGVWELSEKMALEKAKEAIEMAESQLPIPNNGDYTSTETSCRGCMGPCGQCDEEISEGKDDKGKKVGDTVNFEYWTSTLDGSEFLEGVITEDLGNRTYKVSVSGRELIITDADIF